MLEINGVTYVSYNSALKILNLPRTRLDYLIYEHGRFLNEEVQTKFSNRMKDKIQSIKENKEKMRKVCKERFTGVEKTEEHKNKIKQSNLLTRRTLEELALRGIGK